VEELGFKLITSENWNVPDKTTVIYTCPFDYDKKTEVHPYLDQILKPKLNNEVPIEVRRLFEVARGTRPFAVTYPRFE